MNSPRHILQRCRTSRPRARETVRRARRMSDRAASSATVPKRNAIGAGNPSTTPPAVPIARAPFSHSASPRTSATPAPASSIRRGGDPFQVEHSSQGSWLVDASIYPGDAPQLTETSFARLVTGTRQLSDRQFVRTVHLRRRETSRPNEYERIFGAAVIFGQQRNAMLMDPDWFSLPLPATSPYADTVLAAHAERLLTKFDPASPARRSVSDLVLERITSGARTMSAAARDLGMSRTTLYRALRDEGTTFERIFDRARKDLAIALLEGGRSITETAYRLGFSDRSAFSRAFKRWTGTSPGSTR